jgi:hypothetical protein
MKKKLTIALSLLAVALAAVLVYSLVIQDSASAPSNSTSDGTQSSDLESTQQTVAVVGTITCLTPSDNTGTQASSCAVGLQQDNGSSYALSSDNSDTSNLSTGQRVEVTGVVVDPQQEKYQTEGTIKVESVKPL